jgi:hypothetical protein
MREQVDAAATEYDALKRDVNTKVLMVEDHRLRMLNSTLEAYQVTAAGLSSRGHFENLVIASPLILAFCRRSST